VPIKEAVVTGVRQDASGIAVDGMRARYLVAADGLHSQLRRTLGLEGRLVGLRRYGMSRHFTLSPWTSFVEVHWAAAAAEAYVTPLAADVVGVAVLTSTRGSFDAHLAQFEELVERLGSAEVTGGTLGAGPLWRRSSSRVAGRALLVGDAAGYVDALTGEGVAMALTQAQAAVRAIVADDLRGYEQDWCRITRRYRVMTSSLLRASQVKPVRRALVPAAARAPRVFAAAVNAIATA
jgi:flavin-dependent dehydrogenase